MKNEHILPNTLVPEDIRIEIYTQAITHIETKSRKYIDSDRDGNVFSLCLLLPCILWDLPTYLSYAPEVRLWDYRDITTMFPEMKNAVKTINDAKKFGKCTFSKGEYTEKELNEVRVRELKEAINILQQIKQ
jgi:hypothetical protein